MTNKTTTAERDIITYLRSRALIDQVGHYMHAAQNAQYVLDVIGEATQQFELPEDTGVQRDITDAERARAADMVDESHYVVNLVAEAARIGRALRTSIDPGSTWHVKFRSLTMHDRDTDDPTIQQRKIPFDTVYDTRKHAMTDTPYVTEFVDPVGLLCTPRLIDMPAQHTALHEERMVRNGVHYVLALAHETAVLQPVLSALASQYITYEYVVGTMLPDHVTQTAWAIHLLTAFQQTAEDVQHQGDTPWQWQRPRIGATFLNTVRKKEQLWGLLSATEQVWRL